MYYIGCDPDTQNLALAIVDDSGLCVAVACVKQVVKSVSRTSVLSMAKALRSHMMTQSMPQADWVAGWAVEGQELYLNGPNATKNPRSIMFLTATAGAAVATLTAYYPDCPSFFPAPGAWKGTIPKGVHQARICSRLGWEYKQIGIIEKSHCILETPPAGVIGADLLNPSDWKHVLDAVGLALWARDQIRNTNRIKDAVDASQPAEPTPRVVRKLPVRNPPSGRGPGRKRKG